MKCLPPAATGRQGAPYRLCGAPELIAWLAPRFPGRRVVAGEIWFEGRAPEREDYERVVRAFADRPDAPIDGECRARCRRVLARLEDRSRRAGARSHHERRRALADLRNGAVHSYAAMDLAALRSAWGDDPVGIVPWLREFAQEADIADRPDPYAELQERLKELIRA